MKNQPCIPKYYKIENCGTLQNDRTGVLECLDEQKEPEPLQHAYPIKSLMPTSRYKMAVFSIDMTKEPLWLFCKKSLRKYSMIFHAHFVGNFWEYEIWTHFANFDGEPTTLVLTD